MGVSTQEVTTAFDVQLRDRIFGLDIEPCFALVGALVAWTLLPPLTCETVAGLLSSGFLGGRRGATTGSAVRFSIEDGGVCSCAPSRLCCLESFGVNVKSWLTDFINSSMGSLAGMGEAIGGVGKNDMASGDCGFDTGLLPGGDIIGEDECEPGGRNTNCGTTAGEGALIGEDSIMGKVM